MPFEMGLSEQFLASSRIRESAWIGIVVIYLLFFAVVVRTMALEVIRLLLPWYLGLEFVFIVIFTTVLLRPAIQATWLHLYLVVQTVIILVLLSFRPQFDLITVLFVLLSFQAALIFHGVTRWVWIGVFVLLTGGSLVYFLGLAEGLVKGLFPMAACIIFAAHEMANQESETARAESQKMLTKLQETHRQLELHASQVEKLAAVEERNRLARELHDSISQTMFSILLNVRASQIYLQREPGRMRPQLELILSLTQNTLAQMRSLITHLRHPEPEPVSDNPPPRQNQEQS